MGDTGRVPALDGLRGVAILLVVARHSGLPVGQGGSVGVAVFFVLSGYLITGLLLARPAPGTFYLRRAARLLPALLALLLLLVLAEPRSSLAVLMYGANWYLNANRGGMGPLSHTWTLAVEEQFYLVWPLVLLLVPRRRLPAALVGVIAVSLALRFGLESYRAYLGTDTNAYALALGSLLALRPTRLPAWLGVLLLAALVPWSVSSAQLWAPVLAAVGAVALISSRPAWLTPRWLQHCGQVSYGWYLWHVPVLWFVVKTDEPDWRTGVPAVLLALVIAEVSYRWLEMPVRRWAHRATAKATPPTLALRVR